MQPGYGTNLREDYYLANFHRLAGFVCNTYADILNEHELHWYRSLSSASVPAQKLYVRLLTRKGSTFRLGRLRYSEIDDLLSAADELAGLELADILPPENLTELIAGFTKPELLRLPGALANGLRSSLSRYDIVQRILGAGEEQLAVYVQTLQQADRWITLTGHRYWTIFRLAFFGNLYQDSSEFVLADLGAVRYESYHIDASARAFVDRRQLDDHLRYFECEALSNTVDQRDSAALLALASSLPGADHCARTTVEPSSEVTDKVGGAQASRTGNSTHDDERASGHLVMDDVQLCRRVDRFRNGVARKLERLGDLASAHALYSQSIHPPARERRIRLHLMSEEWMQAEMLLDSMENFPFNEAELQVAERLRLHLNRQKGVKAGRRQRFRPQSNRLVLHRTGKRVELAARDFYSRFGCCFYTENSLINSVMGLFIWDIVFMTLPGAFFNPFQSAPADFRHPSFLHRRESLLNERLLQLADPSQFAARVMNNFTTHFGKANPLVSWQSITEELLTLALQRIPSRHWEVMFRRILRDTRDNTSGFPDLVLFRETGEYEFLEIKGPGDTLQQNQLRWMKCFDEHDIPCRVIQVRWSGESSETVST